MKKTIFIIVVIALSLGYACQETDHDSLLPSDDILYFNTFESSSDTVGWIGRCQFELVEDVPEDGGNQAIMVSCGCVGPFTHFVLESFDTDKRIIASCIGKRASSMGGTVIVALPDGTDFIKIPIQDSLWTNYQSNDTLFLPAGDSLNISIYAGGIIDGTVLVDNIKIIEP